MLTRVIAGLSVLICLAGLAQPGQEAKPNKIIEMRAGNKFAPDRVEVLVGQTVRWLNKDEDQGHTATSQEKGDLKAGELFDTKGVKKDGGKKDVVFDQGLYKRAGGKPGGSVEIEYFCRFHEGMVGTIKLVDKKKGA